MFRARPFPQEKAPPQVTEKAQLVVPDNVQWASCSPEGAKPEEACEYSVLSGDTEKGASGMYVRLPNGCASPKHWAHEPDGHLVGVEGEFIYIFEDGAEVSFIPGAYVFLPGGKVHSERCGAEGALFYLYFEKPVDEHRVAGTKVTDRRSSRYLNTLEPKLRSLSGQDRTIDCQSSEASFVPAGLSPLYMWHCTFNDTLG